MGYELYPFHFIFDTLKNISTAVLKIHTWLWRFFPRTFLSEMHLLQSDSVPESNMGLKTSHTRHSKRLIGSFHLRTLITAKENKHNSSYYFPPKELWNQILSHTCLGRSQFQSMTQRNEQCAAWNPRESWGGLAIGPWMGPFFCQERKGLWVPIVQWMTTELCSAILFERRKKGTRGLLANDT